MMRGSRDMPSEISGCFSVKFSRLPLGRVSSALSTFLIRRTERVNGQRSDHKPITYGVPPKVLFLDRYFF